MLTLPVLLIALPIVAGGIIYCMESDALRRVAMVATILVVSVGTILLAARLPISIPIKKAVNADWFDTATFFVELAMMFYIIYVGISARSALVLALATIQGALLVWFEATQASHLKIAQNLFVDQFSVIMALINGLVGGGICLYAIGYMREYHLKTHPETRDRRRMFFALLLVFMGAMFGLIFANNLLWLGCFWEITTLCSFLLIGYSQTDEARRNALRALVMNLSGGVAFTLAVVWLHWKTGRADMQSLLAAHQAAVLVPAALFCFAGVTKAAQLPFSSWLLGAMVAPTPVSALLHSSTMVKAGVYLILRMAPIVANTRVGLILAIIGGLTFVISSFAAITCSEAKRVLAHSTIANLGLIVLCGGLGTPQAVWAGILLIIFHALAKCLLFLCVGILDNKLHTRDIENMSGLIVKMPQVAAMMLVGMAGMFLAPFGMLISKWAVLKAVVDASPMLSIFIVFGSSATLFFWAKWMGKVLQVTEPTERLVAQISLGQRIAIYALTAATFGACLFLPLISSRLVEPYVRTVFGQTGSFAPGNMVIISVLMAIVLLFPLAFLRKGRTVKVVEPYLGGANVQGYERFRGSAGKAEDVVMGNYYLHEMLSESWLSRCGSLLSSGLLALMLGMALL